MIRIKVQRPQPRLTTFTEPDCEAALRAFLADVPESLRVPPEKVEIVFDDDMGSEPPLRNPVRFYVSDCDDSELEDAAKVAAVLASTMQFPACWNPRITHDVFWPRAEEAARHDPTIYPLGSRLTKTLGINWLAGIPVINM